MSDIFEKFAEAHRAFPEGADQLRREEQAVQDIMVMQDLAAHEGMQKLLAACRSTVISCRLQLATDKALVDNPQKQRDLWSVIEARTWFISTLSQDFPRQLKLIEDQLAEDLAAA